MLVASPGAIVLVTSLCLMFILLHPFSLRVPPHPIITCRPPPHAGKSAKAYYHAWARDTHTHTRACEYCGRWVKKKEKKNRIVCFLVVYFVFFWCRSVSWWPSGVCVVPWFRRQVCVLLFRQQLAVALAVLVQRWKEGRKKYIYIGLASDER